MKEFVNFCVRAKGGAYNEQFLSLLIRCYVFYWAEICEANASHFDYRGLLA